MSRLGRLVAVLTLVMANILVVASAATTVPAFGPDEQACSYDALSTPTTSPRSTRADTTRRANASAARSLSSTAATKPSRAAKARLPRFEGPKPTYDINPAHVPGRGLRPGKTPLPADAEDVFRKAVPNDPTNPSAWFGRNDAGRTYRYSVDNAGGAHFSGIDGVGDGVRNLTKYARGRLDGQ